MMSRHHRARVVSDVDCLYIVVMALFKIYLTSVVSGMKKKPSLLMVQSQGKLKVLGMVPTVVSSLEVSILSRL
jgi:hypothetical protein